MSKADVRPLGAAGSTGWLHSLGHSPPTQTRWSVEIALDVAPEPAPFEWDDASATRFHVDVYSDEWGFYVCHAGRSSWIRVTDIAFVHGRDDFQLLKRTPSLDAIGALVRELEEAHGIRFQRHHAAIRTNLPKIEASVRAWIAKL